MLLRVHASRDQLLDHMPVHIGEAAVDAVTAVSELGVVDAELVEDGSVYVVAGGGIGAIEGFVAPLIGFTSGGAAFDATTAEPVGEDVGIVVAP